MKYNIGDKVRVKHPLGWNTGIVTYAAQLAREESAQTVAVRWTPPIDGRIRETYFTAYDYQTSIRKIEDDDRTASALSETALVFRELAN